jgi:hypothetical protein
MENAMNTFLVPVNNDGQIQISDRMRRDAVAAMGSVDAGGGLPRLYLCQATGTIVRSGAAADKDFVVSAGDDVVNLGREPMFIVLTAQTRYRHSVHDDAEDKEQVLWDAAKGCLSAAQDADVAAKRAKRYTLFTLLHVNENGINPSGIGPIMYAAKGMSTLAGMKLADAVAGMIYKNVPPFLLAWRFGSKPEESVKGRGSWNVLTHEAPMLLKPDDPTYTKLKESWEFADARRRHDEHAPAAAPVSDDGPTHAELADREAATQPSPRRVQEHEYGSATDPQADRSGTTGYATELPADEEVKPAAFQQVLNDDPLLMSTWVANGWNWDTPMPIDDYGTLKPIRRMTESEVKSAIAVADSRPVTNTKARDASKMLAAWLEGMQEVPF